MNDFTPGRFLSISETAELLTVSVTQVYNLVHRGELIAIRVGTRGPWRIDISVVQAFIDDQYEMARRSALWHQSEFADIGAI
ncbi:MAG: excisionase family DNA binding protein [Alpinimonas sp.]|jgi:excisionase family DNA binding protein